MASVFRRSYATTVNGRKVRRKCRKYTVKFKDASGSIRTVSGYTDKAASEQLGARLEREAARGIEHMADPHSEALRRPLRAWPLMPRVAGGIADIGCGPS